MTYFLAPRLAAVAEITAAKIRAGISLGTNLLLTGPPGAGKSQFAGFLARKLGCECFKHYCSQFNQDTLLYRINVGGVLRREKAWARGPAWLALEASYRGPVVLLVDEIDKDRRGLVDPLLLQLLEGDGFVSPDGDARTITGHQKNLVVVMTSNGRRELPEELLRRVKRVSVAMPDTDTQKKIIRQLSGRQTGHDGLIDLLIRLRKQIASADEAEAATPKELAAAFTESVIAASAGLDISAYQGIAEGYLVKKKPELLRALKFNVSRALKTEAERG
jgi:MoxR-like ATPase